MKEKLYASRDILENIMFITPSSVLVTPSPRATSAWGFTYQYPLFWI